MSQDAFVPMRTVEVPDCPQTPSGGSNDIGVPCQSTDVWFADGTIIIQAESTQFKVYRGILAANSPIFGDLFTVPQPDYSDTIEGCSLIHLSDSAVDTMHFLKALHFPGYYDPTRTTSFMLIAAILRLAAKYNVEYLHQCAFRQLASLYPTTLDAWDKRVDNAIEVFEARPFAVLRLAKETGHTSLLPACMYLCADSINLNDILDGLASVDGKHIELEWAEKRACLRARQNLLLALRSRIFKFLMSTIDPPGHCTSPTFCDSAKYKWIRSLEASLNNGSPGVFSLKFPWSAFGQTVCENCFRTAQAHSNQQRQAIWDELPGFFDLPSWDQIHDDM